MFLNNRIVGIVKQIIFHSLCVAGIVLIVLTFFYTPGVYNSLLSGSVLIDSENDLNLVYIKFECRTNKKWYWKKPINYSYSSMELDLHKKNKATIYFPSLICKYNNKEEPLSKKLFGNLLKDNSEDKTDLSFLAIDKFYDFIMSVNNGTLPPPRHHPYSLDSPYMGHFVHFCLGGGSYLRLLGLVLLLSGTIFQSIALFKNKKVTFDIWVLLISALVNLALYYLGIVLDFYPGSADILGARFCRTSIGMFPFLIFITVVYSIFISIKKKGLNIVAIYWSTFLYFIVIFFSSKPYC